MQQIYSFTVFLSWQLLKIVGLFNPKIAQFVQGRKKVTEIIKTRISPSDNIIWIHAASLGEYEQGLPILEKLKQEYSNYKILLTFFSPSGYEIKKNSSPADITTYLPLDTPKKVKSFIDAAHPKLVIFIKYEVWPNYLSELKKNDIPAILISARFNTNKIYFKYYGGFMRKALHKFTAIYVQDKNSQDLLRSIGINEVIVSGDTRLDRVSEILERDNSLSFMDDFCRGKDCFVAGSTWPEDETHLVDYINQTNNDYKFVIAPHNIKKDHIQNLIKAIEKKALVFSHLPKNIPDNVQVIIIDTIGLLTKIYSYASIAYVGGGFATGLHNTLEPAVFGIPVIIGPKYQGFLEAEDLVKLGGVLSVSSKEEFFETTNTLFKDSKRRQKIGELNSQYILSNKGASVQIMQGIRTLL